MRASGARLGLTILVLLALTATTGCAGAGGGDQSFNEKGYPFKFSFPAGWTLTRQLPLDSGEALNSVTVARKAPLDQVTVARYRLKKPLPAGTNAYATEVNRIVARISRESGGHSGSGSEQKFGGLPGYQHVIMHKVDGVELETRLTLLFRGSDEFVVSCQSAPPQRQQVEDGCETILKSIKFD